MSDNFSPAMLEEAAKIAKATLDGGLQSWGKSFNRSVTLEFGGVETKTSAAVEITGPFAVTVVNWGGERSGKFFVVVPETIARGAIAFFLSAALGTPPDMDAAKLDKDGMDAYSELASALVQQGAQTLRGELKGKIEWTVEKNEAVANTNAFTAIAGSENLLCASGQVTIDGITPAKIFMLMTGSCTGISPSVETTGAGDAATASATADTTNAALAKKIKFTHRNEKLALKLHLPVIVVLATTKKRVESVQEISPGSIIEFRKFAGEFLDVKAGNTKIADGEVVIVNQHFGVQLRKMTPQIPFASMLKKMG